VVRQAHYDNFNWIVGEGFVNAAFPYRDLCRSLLYHSAPCHPELAEGFFRSSRLTGYLKLILRTFA
jgi:hypothetical protein